MFIRILKIAFIFLLSYILLRIVKFYLFIRRALKSGYGNNAGMYTENGSGKTIKCDNCASYVALELCVSANKKGDIFHFCSEDCKREYLRHQ